MHGKFVVFGRALLIVLLGIVCMPPYGHAAESERERELGRRLYQQQRERMQLEAERRRLDAQVTELGQQADRLKGVVAEARDAEASARGRLKTASAENVRLGKQLEAMRTDLEALRTAATATKAELGRSEEGRRTLEARLAAQRQVVARQAAMVSDCEDRNAKLYQFGSALLSRFRQTEVSDAVGPLGLDEVAAYKVWQDYRQKLDSARLPVPLAIKP